jgi:hypothetical protein
MMKTYKGRYKVENPMKYKGDHTSVIYRSSWELYTCKWCDRTPDVVEWSSEEVVIPYICGTDNRAHRYFMDFYVKYRSGEICIIEVKPAKQTKPPAGKRKTKQYLNEVTTYVKNASKWKAAEDYAATRGWKFVIWTEHELMRMEILPKPLKPLKKMPAFKKKKKVKKK